MIFINLTYGFGNNLFQFHFGRIISQKYNLNFYCVGKVSIHFKKYLGELPNEYVIIRDNYKNGRKKSIDTLIEEIDQNKNKNILLLGFFEFKDFFIDYQKEIISYHKLNNFLFDKYYFKITKDLNVIHIRLNNRLVSLNHSLNWIDPNKLFDTIFLKFPHIKKWIIISDFKFSSNETENIINQLRNELLEGPNKYSFLINRKHSISYINDWNAAIQKHKDRLTLLEETEVDSVNFLNSSGGLNSEFLNDFKILMNSENIMFWGSTFSWWASFLSNKSSIIIGSPWRMDRKPDFDPSLDKTNFHNIQNIDLKVIKYNNHKKRSLLVRYYDMIPFMYRAFYSKLINYLNKKIFLR